MESGGTDGKQCPWCERWCLKDGACHYVFSCGLDFQGRFHVGEGCGRTWCWTCGKKYCTPYHDATTGEHMRTAKNTHTATCCTTETGFVPNDYCPGGHSAHCPARW